MEVKKNVRIKNGLINLSDDEVRDVIDNDYIILHKNCNPYSVGIIDKEGNSIIDFKYTNIRNNGNLFICTNIVGACDIYDKEGKKVLDTTDLSLIDSNEFGILLKSGENRYILLDNNGNIKVDVVKDFYHVGLFKDFIVGIEYKNKKDNFVMINEEGNNLEYSFNKYPDNKEITCNYFNDYIIVKTLKNIFLINKEGKVVNSVRKYKNLDKCDAFNNDIILLANDKLLIKKENEKTVNVTNSFNKYKVIDNVIIYYNDVHQNSKFLICTKEGLQYEADYVLFNSYKDGYIKFVSNNEFGIINTKTGNKDIDSTYTLVKYLGNDFFEIEHNDSTEKKHGFFNLKDDYCAYLDNKVDSEVKENNYKINYLGDFMLLFSNNDVNKLYNMLDNSLKSIDFKVISTYENGYAIAMKDYKYGIVDTNCNIILPFVFDNITRLGKRYLINDELVSIDGLKYDYNLELYSDNNKLIYERVFKKEENLNAAYDYFNNQIEEYEKRKDRYQARMENEFKTSFKDEDIRKIKRNVKVK